MFAYVQMCKEDSQGHKPYLALLLHSPPHSSAKLFSYFSWNVHCRMCVCVPIWGRRTRSSTCTHIQARHKLSRKHFVVVNKEHCHLCNQQLDQPWYTYHCPPQWTLLLMATHTEWCHSPHFCNLKCPCLAVQLHAQQVLACHAAHSLTHYFWI